MSDLKTPTLEDQMKHVKKIETLLFNPDKHFVKLAFHFGYKDEAIEKWNRRA